MPREHRCATKSAAPNDSASPRRSWRGGAARHSGASREQPALIATHESSSSQPIEAW